MKKTTNYQLNQWEATDRVKRADFNADNAAIDAALGECIHMMTGYYTGDGTTRTFDLGVKPKAVLVFSEGYMTYANNVVRGGMAFPDKSITGLSVTDTGFTVSGDTNRVFMFLYIVFY